MSMPLSSNDPTAVNQSGKVSDTAAISTSKSKKGFSATLRHTLMRTMKTSKEEGVPTADKKGLGVTNFCKVWSSSTSSEYEMLDDKVKGDSHRLARAQALKKSMKVDQPPLTSKSSSKPGGRERGSIANVAEELSGKILNVNKKNKNEISEFLSDVKALKYEKERMNDYAKRLNDSKAALAEAKTKEEKEFCEERLARDQLAMEKNTANIQSFEKKLKEAFSMLKEYRTILENAGQKEATSKVNAFLSIFDESGNVTDNYQKLKDFIFNNDMSTGEKTAYLLNNANILRGQTWEEENLLRSPLNPEGVEKNLAFYNEVSEKLLRSENKQLLQGLGTCLLEINKALEEFHALSQENFPIEKMIGQKTQDGHSHIHQQDLSSLSHEQLTLLDSKAKELKNILVDIHAHMRSLPFAKEGEPLFTAISGVYGYLENSISTLTGEDKQMPGKNVVPNTQPGQIDVLLNLIKEEIDKRQGVNT